MLNIISRFLIFLAYTLEGSDRYKAAKALTRNLLENDNYPFKKYFDIFMIFLTLSSVAILIHEVRSGIPEWVEFYNVYFITTVFVLEYLLRLWVFSDARKVVIEHHENALFLGRDFRIKEVLGQIMRQKLAFVTSPLAIIDLLAILPSYRPLGILRVFVLFRVFKILRYTYRLSALFQMLSLKRFELFTLLLLVAFLVFVSGVALYVFEGQENKNINTIFDAIYLALVTISTVGYGDIAPISNEGRAIAMIIILAGLGLISFATSIIVSAFSEKLDEISESRVIGEMGKLSNYFVICGYSRIAQIVASRLQAAQKPFVILDIDEERVKEAAKNGYLAIRADAARADIMAQLHIDKKSDAVLSLAATDIQNVYIILTVRSLSKNVKIITRARSKNSYKKLYLAGANHIVSPYELAGMMAVEYVGQPLAFEAINAILSEKEQAKCEEIEVARGSFLDGKTIGQIDFSRYRLILLGVVRRFEEEGLAEKKSQFIFNPPEDFLIMPSDTLVLMGYDISIKHFQSEIQGSALHYGTRG